MIDSREREQNWKIKQPPFSFRDPQTVLASSFPTHFDSRLLHLEEGRRAMLDIPLNVLPLNRPLARSGHMVRNKLHWDASYAVGLPNKETRTSPARLSFVFKVPLRNLRPSVIYSGPCDQIVQRAYYCRPFRRRYTLHLRL